MMLPRYKSYKKSEIEWLGDVPGHWAVKRIRFLVDINPSKSEANGLARDDEVSFLPMEAIGDDGTLNLDRTRQISDVETGYTYFREGDVTIAKITPCFENGKGAIMTGLAGGIGFGTTELIVARPRKDTSSSAYLYWLFSSVPFRSFGEASMYGAGGQKRVPDDFVRDFALGIPPIDEQSSIASFLDRETAKIDALVAEQEKLIELLKEKRQAVISHAVTKGLDPDAPMKDSGIDWLGKTPRHWSLSRVGVLCSKIGSGKTPLGGAESYSNSGILFLRSQNVYDEGLLLEEVVYISEEIDEGMQGSRVLPGDILLNITGASLGRTCLVPDGFEPANVNQHVCIVRMRNPTHRRFMAMALKSAYCKFQFEVSQTGAARDGLNFQQISRLAIALPPEGEQELIVRFIERQFHKIDGLIADARNSIALLKEHRSALISAAVTGKIDVRGLVGAEAA